MKNFMEIYVNCVTLYGERVSILLHINYGVDWDVLRRFMIETLVKFALKFFFS